MSSNSALVAYESRDDLKRYGASGLILFALQMHLGIDDIDSVAATALTDGPNDKSCDLVYVNKDSSSIVVAQGYYTDQKRRAARSAKASDLNSAVGWLLHGKLEDMPQSLRSAAIEVRQALEEDEIQPIELWYVHNCPESANVASEMDQVAATAKKLISKQFAQSQVTSIAAREVGSAMLENWYRRTEVPIVVTDTFTVPIDGGFIQKSDKWSAFCTSVSGSWLRDIWREYETELLSPNVRDYLGLVKSEKNINYGIKKSAREESAQFWIFNNGLTIIVNDFRVTGKDKGGVSQLIVDGLGIVNGAQTTGTLGTLTDPEAQSLANLRVMVRFVKCQDPDVLRDIVRFNNTQNKIEAADFRSNDSTQERLRQEFSLVPDAEYRGGRRGGVRDVIERKKNQLLRLLRRFMASRIWRTMIRGLYGPRTQRMHRSFLTERRLNILCFVFRCCGRSRKLSSVFSRQMKPIGHRYKRMRWISFVDVERCTCCVRLLPTVWNQSLEEQFQIALGCVSRTIAPQGWELIDATYRRDMSRVRAEFDFGV